MAASTGAPTRIDVIWASGASGGNVRAIPDTSADPNAASYTLGWPPNTAVSPGSGGAPPDYRDFNGINRAVTGWLQWLSAGGPVFYDATLSTAIGGYPKWTMLSNAATVGLFWLSTVDNNATNPDASGAGWVQFPPTPATGVSSFNTRTGAVTLTSADVTGALATNALAFSKLASMPAQTFMLNDGVSAADVATGGPNAALDILGFTGTNPGSGAGVAFFPQNSGAVLCRQWGTHAAVAASSNTAVTLSQSLATPFTPRLTTHSNGSGFQNSVAMYVDGTLSGSGFTVNMQNFAAGGSPPSQAFSWEIFGYV